MNHTKEVIYPLKLYIKVGKDQLTAYNGRQVLERYKSFIKIQKEAWFPTNVLVFGMAMQMKAELCKAIKEGQTVEIYFAIGKTYDDSNRIYAKAKVLSIKSSNEKIDSPEPFYTPSEWQMHQAKCWILLSNFVEVEIQESEVKEYVVVSSGRALEYAIERPQMHFGYIMKR